MTASSPQLAPLVNRELSLVNRRRNGKVASLSKPHRDLVNQMLEDGAAYSDISAALAQLGFQVSPRNISNWYRGGYQDWLQFQVRLDTTSLQQDALLDLLRTENSTDLPEVGLQLAVTQLSQLLLANSLCPQPTETQANHYLRLANSLSRITRQLIALQQRREDAAYDSEPDDQPAPEPEPLANSKSQAVDPEPAAAHETSPAASNPQSQIVNRKSQILSEAHGNLRTSVEATNNSAPPFPTLAPAAGIASIAPTHELAHST